MYQYFKDLKTVAALDQHNYSIMDLTLKIMDQAGYYLKEKTFKNGNKRLVTAYTKEFDSILVAKWFLFYQKIFVTRLIKHSELKEDWIDIINNTFFIVIMSLKRDKIVNDNVVNKYVNLALLSKINDVLWSRGSPKRLREYETGQSGICLKLKKYLSYNVESYEALREINGIPEEIEDTDDTFLYDLRQQLKHNPYGDYVLKSLLFSNKKVNLNKIDEFIKVDDIKNNDNMQFLILDAWNIIKKELCNYSKKEFIPDKKINFSKRC